MERQIIWSRWDEEVGLEHLHFWSTKGGYIADSWLIGATEIPYRISYQITLNEAFHVRQVSIQTVVSKQQASLELLSDGQGNWTNQGQLLAEFKGCIDIDLSLTPFTNTLPIRRLHLKPGQSQEIEVIYIALPELKLRRFKQRYTYLKEAENGEVYRYESLDKTRFKSELTVDQDGLVLEYNEAFSQVWVDDE